MISLSGASADELWLAARDEFLSGSAAEVEGRGSPTKELRPVFFELTDPRSRWVFSRSPVFNQARPSSRRSSGAALRVLRLPGETIPRS